MGQWLRAVIVLAAWRLLQWLLGHAEGPPWQGISWGELALLALLVVWFLGRTLRPPRRRFV
jgi:hypothetical protein